MGQALLPLQSLKFMAAADFTPVVFGVGGFVVFIIFIGLLTMLVKCYRKVEQGQALVRNGMGGTKVSFSGSFIVPIMHQAEYMDISVKRVEIERAGNEGLICKDNMRADIKVAFFVRVNKTIDDVLKVAQAVGCDRASNQEALRELFDAKFSEALKTVGKQFNFVDLYNSRETFKEEILKIIGTDLNGYILDDAAIDFLEQTPITLLNADNILDAEGIKKITELTAQQKILANQIDRDKEKTITKQDVEAKEAILELNRQLAETEERQKKEVASIKAREESETKRTQEEERQKAESARISTDEELAVAEENKERQILVARKNKERTDAVETERVEKDRALEATERERIVELAKIEKEKAVENEKRDIQDVIRERVMVEKTVVEEKERMKDIEAFATAERSKKVSIVDAEKAAEEALVKEIKAAEASKQAAALEAEENLLRKVQAAEAEKQSMELTAQQILIEAEAKQAAALKDAEAKKALAEATSAEAAAQGLGEVQVQEARASAIEKEGGAEAKVLEMKFHSEAKGLEEKAAAMKKLDGVGKEHEEFKLELEKAKEIELAEIDKESKVASYHSDIMAEALKSAKVDIVGGETAFFENIVGAVSKGKSVDATVNSSNVLGDVKETFFNSDPEYFASQLRSFVSQFNMSTEDLKNLSVASALQKLVGEATGQDTKSQLYGLLAMAERSGFADKPMNAITSLLGSK